MTAGDITVRLGDDADIELALATLNAGYDHRTFTPEWFDGKHRRGPWGPSRMFLAEQDDRVLSVAFGLPWQYRQSGELIDGVRTVDGSTPPAGRGRGGLGRVMSAEIDRWSIDARPGIVIATATPAAQKSHARNNAVTFDPISLGYGAPPLARRADLRRGDEVLDDVTIDGDLIRTDWTPRALRWRTSEWSGYRYDAAALATADAAHGVVYRVAAVRGPLRAVVPIVTWGPSALIRRTLGNVARLERTALCLVPGGPGTADSGATPRRSTATSVICVWDRRPNPASLADYGMQFGELEGLI